MKPVAKKTLLSTAILTAAFSLVLIGGPALGSGGRPKRIGISAVVMGLALAASAPIWATVRLTQTTITGNTDWKNSQ